MDNEELKRIASDSIDYEKLLSKTAVNEKSNTISPSEEIKQDFVWIEYNDSPVRVKTDIGSGHTYQCDIGDHIVALESFPPTKNEGRYTLTLRKAVSSAQQVNVVYDELATKLRELSLCWPFSGGSRMELQSISESSIPKINSNRVELQKEMLARKGISRLSHSVNLNLEIVGTYSNFPLANAITILKRANSDFHLRLMLEYYQEAFVDKKSWFIHLYKIRDAINHADKIHNPPSKRFSISKKKWKKFGQFLNKEYNLRHAPDQEKPIPTIPSVDKEFVFAFGREMIIKYLDFLSLPHN